jgi:hypothetical protein
MMQFNSWQGWFGGVKCLKSPHAIGYFLHKPVVLLNDVIEVLNVSYRHLQRQASNVMFITLEACL